MQEGDDKKEGAGQGQIPHHVDYEDRTASSDLQYFDSLDETYALARSPIPKQRVEEFIARSPYNLQESQIVVMYRFSIASLNNTDFAGIFISKNYILVPRHTVEGLEPHQIKITSKHHEGNKWEIIKVLPGSGDHDYAILVLNEDVDITPIPFALDTTFASSLYFSFIDGELYVELAPAKHIPFQTVASEGYHPTEPGHCGNVHLNFQGGFLAMHLQRTQGTPRAMYSYQILEDIKHTHPGLLIQALQGPSNTIAFLPSAFFPSDGLEGPLTKRLILGPIRRFRRQFAKVDEEAFRAGQDGAYQRVDSDTKNHESDVLPGLTNKFVLDHVFPIDELSDLFRHYEKYQSTIYRTASQFIFEQRKLDNSRTPASSLIVEPKASDLSSLAIEQQGKFKTVRLRWGDPSLEFSHGAYFEIADARILNEGCQASSSAVALVTVLEPDELESDTNTEERTKKRTNYCIHHYETGGRSSVEVCDRFMAAEVAQVPIYLSMNKVFAEAPANPAGIRELFTTITQYMLDITGDQTLSPVNRGKVVQLFSNITNFFAKLRRNMQRNRLTDTEYPQSRLTHHFLVRHIIPPEVVLKIQTIATTRWEEYRAYMFRYLKHWYSKMQWGAANLLSVLDPARLTGYINRNAQSIDATCLAAAGNQISTNRLYIAIQKDDSLKYTTLSFDYENEQEEGSYLFSVRNTAAPGAPPRHCFHEVFSVSEAKLKAEYQVAGAAGQQYYTRI